MTTTSGNRQISRYPNWNFVSLTKQGSRRSPSVLAVSREKTSKEWESPWRLTWGSKLKGRDATV